MTSGSTALRIGLVVALLGLASHGLSGRRDLDWSRLTQPPDAPVAVVVLVLLAAAVLVATARTIRLMTRVLHRPSPDGLPDADVTLPPRWAKLAVLVMLALLVWALYLLAGLDSRDQTPQPADLEIGEEAAATADGSGALGTLTTTGLVLLAAAAALLIALRVVGRSRRAEPGDDTPDEVGAEEPPPGRVLTDAVAAAETELAGHADDVRAAIVAAYAAMEAELAHAGTTRAKSDTPTDLLRRAVSAGHVPAAPARELTDLFREARFSSHPMPEARRQAAARALAAVTRAPDRAVVKTPR